MRLDNDFDDNLKELYKYALIICVAAIVVWCIVTVAHWIIPGEEEDDLMKDDTNIEETLSKLVDADNNGEELLFDKDDIQIQTVGDKNFILYINELPDDIYFSQIYTQDKQLAEKREIVNKKVGDNYIDSVLSYGLLVRWNPESFPLKVYIEVNKNLPEYFTLEIKNAFQRWQDTTHDFISFEYVDSPDNANIVCTFPETFIRSCDSNKMGQTSKQYFTYDENGKITRSNIEMTYDDCNGELYAQDMVYAIALREIGHALGLRGHSGNSTATVLYYPESNRGHSVRPVINKSDINTLRLIYSIEPDKINQNLTPEQKAKLISADEIWGDKFERSANNEKAMLYNLEMSPDVPDLYVSLANYYKERQEYDKAISVYSRSIVIMNDAEWKSKVYARVGDTYNLQNRYPEAIEAYRLSLKNLTNKKNLFDVYFNLGVIYFKQGKYNDSLANFQEALKYVYDKENSYRLLINMAETYLKTGNYINAMKCAEKANSIKQSNISTYLLAYSKYKNSEHEDAQTILETSTKDKSPAVMYALLAQIYYETQQYAALEKLAEQIKSEYPDKVIFTFK